MNMLKGTVCSTLALAALVVASGCAVDMPAEEDIASNEAAVCANPDGVNAVMAALAVAAAKEMHRWLPQRDFVWDSASNMLKLSSYAYPRCPNRVCPNTQAILDMQKPSANGVVFPGGATLNTDALRSRLHSYYDRQIVCNSRPDNHAADDCPTEYHDLTFSNAIKGSCDTDFWFHATKQGSTSLLQYPSQLKNQLIFVGYPDNPYLAFDSQGDDVKIDPTGGLVEGDPTASGSCAAVCSKYSVTNIGGQCCSCNGVTKKFKVSAFSSAMFLCQ